MLKAYITAPYTSKAGVVKGKYYEKLKDESFKNLLLSIEATAKSCNFSTILPHRDHYQWGNIHLEPEILIQKAFKGVKESDVLIAYPETSKGVNILIGWASVLGRKIVVLLNEKEDVSIVYAGLGSIAETKIIKFKDIMDLKMKLGDCLNEIARNYGALQL